MAEEGGFDAGIIRYTVEKGRDTMSVLKKILTYIGNVIKIIFGTIGGYIGVVINLFGTVLGLMASFLVVAVVIVVCLYVKIEPMF